MYFLKTHPKPLPITHPSFKKAVSNLKGVFFDIDETFSTRGKITAEAFEALWALQKKGFALVPVTGRPAGWCDHIARFWPVNAVVGENGAFTFYMKDGVLRRLNTGPSGASERLARLREEIEREFPHARMASDQAYREFDLAVDVCEDVKPWAKREVERLLAFCRSKDATAKLSSVHVNIWYGEHDKCRGIEAWFEAGCPGARKSKLQEWIFIGDSPNDEPLFQRFEKSVGVANVREYLSEMDYPPHWVTQKESGAGFAEVAEKLL